MRIREATRPYLNGRTYSNSVKMRLPAKGTDLRYQSRVQILKRIVKDKRVIHIGFADHNIASIESKKKNGTWLHAQLAKVADVCFGVDIDQIAVNYVRDALGYEDVAALDITKDSHSRIDTIPWDVVLLPEVLEHIDDPGAFLKAIRLRFARPHTQFVITVPNAFRLKNFLGAKQGYEEINSDHRFWFTPYTLAKVVTMAGLYPQKIVMGAQGSIKRDAKTYLTMAKNPLLRDNIILVAQDSNHI